MTDGQSLRADQGIRRKKFIKYGIIGSVLLIIAALAIVLPIVLIKKTDDNNNNDDHGHGPLPPGKMNPY